MARSTTPNTRESKWLSLSSRDSLAHRQHSLIYFMRGTRTRMGRLVKQSSSRASGTSSQRLHSISAAHLLRSPQPRLHYLTGARSFSIAHSASHHIDLSELSTASKVKAHECLSLAFRVLDDDGSSALTFHELTKKLHSLWDSGGHLKIKTRLRHVSAVNPSACSRRQPIVVFKSPSLRHPCRPVQDPAATLSRAQSLKR